MTQYLRQSTAATLKLGPFVDTDGAATTGLTISQADVRLSKNGGNMAQKNETTSCTHDEIGLYDCPVDTTDTNTLGRLDVAVAETGALIVVQSFTVIPAEVYDSMFGASRPRGNILASGTIGATGNSTTALHLTGQAYADDGLNDYLISICDVSTGLVHSTYISDWANTGDLATVPTLPFTPEASVDTYVVFAIKKDPNVATILADTNELQTDWANGGRLDNILDARASQASVDTIDNFLDTEIADILTAVQALQTYPKNVAIAAFMFYMEDADGAAVTGATVSTFISKDGGAFAATATATATEVSSGWYKVALTQTEANCDELAFRATATGARTCNMKVRMQG